MSSVLGTISQISPQMRYLFAVTSTKAWTSQTATPLVAESQFSSVFTAIPDLSGNTLLRDMGKTTVLTNPVGMHVATLRRVQLVYGPDTEGVPDNWDTNGQFYVSIWTDDPTTDYKVSVVRTG
jgi:hypothetical protein